MRTRRHRGGQQQQQRKLHDEPYAVVTAAGSSPASSPVLRAKTLEVGGLVAVTSALQAAAAAALGLYLFGSVLVFCALVVGSYYFVWHSQDDNEEETMDGKDTMAMTARRRKAEWAQLERGLGGGPGGLGMHNLLARFLAAKLVAAGEKLAAFRRSVLGFSFTVSLADSAPLPLEPPRNEVEIAIISSGASNGGPPAPPPLEIARTMALPSHLKMQPVQKTAKKVKKARRKPKDLVTIFTANLARDAPIAQVERVPMAPIARVTPAAPSSVAPVKPKKQQQLEVIKAPAPVVAAPVSPLAISTRQSEVIPMKRELVAAPAPAPVAMPPLVLPPVLPAPVEVAPIVEVPVLMKEPEVALRKVILYEKPLLEVMEEAVDEEEPMALDEPEAELGPEEMYATDDADFLFNIELEPVTPQKEWEIVPMASSIANPELREMVEDLDAMSREVEAALVASSALLLAVSD